MREQELYYILLSRMGATFLAGAPQISPIPTHGANPIPSFAQFLIFPFPAKCSIWSAFYSQPFLLPNLSCVTHRYLGHLCHRLAIHPCCSENSAKQKQISAMEDCFVFCIIRDLLNSWFCGNHKKDKNKKKITHCLQNEKKRTY